MPDTHTARLHLSERGARLAAALSEYMVALRASAIDADKAGFLSSDVYLTVYGDATAVVTIGGKRCGRHDGSIASALAAAELYLATDETADIHLTLGLTADGRIVPGFQRALAEMEREVSGDDQDVLDRVSERR